jgi:hypothetical protein
LRPVLRTTNLSLFDYGPLCKKRVPSRPCLRASPRRPCRRRWGVRQSGPRWRSRRASRRLPGWSRRIASHSSRKSDARVSGVRPCAVACRPMSSITSWSGRGVSGQLAQAWAQQQLKLAPVLGGGSSERPRRVRINRERNGCGVPDSFTLQHRGREPYRRGELCPDHAFATRSKRSRFITLAHAATKSRTNFCCASSQA